MNPQLTTLTIKQKQEITELVIRINRKLESFGLQPSVRIETVAKTEGNTKYYLNALMIQKEIKKDLFLEPPLEEGHRKYFVTYEPLCCYTTIGAENVHHAYNKATKLFKGKYTKLYRNFDNRSPNWEFLSVAEFGELLKKV